MGCGSSVAQVSDSVKDGLFRPIRLLDFEKEGESQLEGRVYLLGQTRTQRKIIELDFFGDASQVISCRVRIPVPRIHYDPVQLMYEESQEIFHLGIYGLSVVPPFNRMLALCLQDSLIFLCGGKDFDNYNIKSDCFYYSLTETRKSAPASEERTQPRNKYAANRFQKVASMGCKRYGHCGVYLQKHKCLIVVGGINERGEVVSSCERYAVMDNIWRELPAMHVPRAFANCLQYGSKVYVFGGRSSPNKRPKKIEVFDYETQQWQLLDYKLHRGIEDSLVIPQNNNQILIVGGKTNFGPTRAVVRVDLQEQTYVWDSDMHYEYQAVKGLKTKTGIIVFGGSKDAIEEYRDNQWISKPFEVKKYFDIEDIESFTCTAQSLQVAATEKKTEISPQQKQDFFILGSDDHPCILSANISTSLVQVKKKSLSMKFKMRSKMSVVQYQTGKYFLSGGCDSKGKKSFNSAYFYNSETHQFQQTVKMAEKKHNFAICATQGFIYTFGGFDCLDKLAKKTCAKFNISNESWDSLPTLRRARNKCVAICIGANKIAVFGGTRGDEQVAGIEIFYTSERKFDIFQPNLHIPSSIISAYSDPTNSDRIIILNKTAQNNEITTISLANPHPPSSNRSAVSQNLQTIDLGSFVKTEAPQTKKPEEKEPPKEAEKNVETSIIRIKPTMVEIHPKKLQSQSSQMQLQNEYDEDIEQSFEMEKIDLRKNKIAKIKTEEVSSHEQPQRPPLQKEAELKIEVEQPIRMQSEIPNSEPIHQEPKILEKKEQQPQQETRIIWSQPLTWLPFADYLVVQRIDHTYFLTEKICIEFNKANREARETKVENNSGLLLNLIK